MELESFSSSTLLLNSKKVSIHTKIHQVCNSNTTNNVTDHKIGYVKYKLRK